MINKIWIYIVNDMVYLVRIKVRQLTLFIFKVMAQIK